MRKKHIVAFSALFQEMFLSKDIFLVPYYIAKETGVKAYRRISNSECRDDDCRESDYTR